MKDNDVTTITPYAHQKTTDFIVDTNTCLITSDPGTGKTRAVLTLMLCLEVRHWSWRRFQYWKQHGRGHK